MNPDYDKQTNPRWPHHLDNPVHRARAVARMYRSRLRALDPDACDDCDLTAATFGETWMLNRETLVEPSKELTTAEAAYLVNVHPDTIRKWACMNHPDRPDEKLLPRFKKRGRQRTYLAGKVLEAAARISQARHERRRDLP